MHTLFTHAFSFNGLASANTVQFRLTWPWTRGQPASQSKITARNPHFIKTLHKIACTLLILY